MKMWLLILAFPAAVWAEEIKLANGQILNGEITRVDPDGLVVMTDSGIEKVSFFSLPAETQERYGFDIKKADAYRAEQAAARQRALEQQAAAIRGRVAQVEELRKNQPTLEEQQRAVEIEVSGFYARVTVLQGNRDGVRAKLVTQTGRAAATMLNKDTRQLVNLGEGFIHGLVGAANEVWEGKLFPAGYHTWTTDYGVERTLRAYATSPEEAVKHGGDGRAPVNGTSVPGSTALPTLPGRLRGGTMLDR